MRRMISNKQVEVTPAVAVGTSLSQNRSDSSKATVLENAISPKISASDHAGSLRVLHLHISQSSISGGRLGPSDTQYSVPSITLWTILGQIISSGMRFRTSSDLLASVSATPRGSDRCSRELTTIMAASQYQRMLRPTHRLAHLLRRAYSHLERRSSCTRPTAITGVPSRRQIPMYPILLVTSELARS